MFSIVIFYNHYMLIFINITIIIDIVIVYDHTLMYMQ